MVNAARIVLHDFCFYSTVIETDIIYDEKLEV